ncbi:hypothetical protein BY996DRAFT_6491787 [Phakopsora pachyrhizi]|uniref:Uncharacterized protein n=1 Tax=Phakopsora pachyrhizi TaxID=170000 RepID=A0AAV0AMZ6_PHAPC|nr:hypothetical protein BY996DRAFT_6491787 [Phakopsora pachyrhizi]CAH7668872.1 hypothetical protein PPACK8108_LOCUS3437 [Phakopsora pachyrhizi]
MKERGKALGWMEWQRFGAKNQNFDHQGAFLNNGSAEDPPRKIDQGRTFSNLDHVDAADLGYFHAIVTEQIWGLTGSPIHRWSYQLPFINHFETIHTGPLVSLISHGGLSVGLFLRESLKG